MGSQVICDHCRQPCQRIVAKLYIAPKKNGRTDHANYSGHADIGECCGEKILVDFKWQRRRKIARRTSADSVGTSTAREKGSQERGSRSAQVEGQAATG